MTKNFFPPLLLDDLDVYFGSPSSVTTEYAKAFRMRLLNFASGNNLDDQQAEVVVKLCDQAAQVFWGMRNLTKSLEDIHAGLMDVETPTSKDVQFSDRIEVLERIVHLLWYQDQHLIFRVFGWASLIYIYTVLRELPWQLGMNPMLAGRIRNGLEKRGDLNVLLATFQDLFLWQMFLCGKVADARDKAFFARQVTRILLVRKISAEVDILAASDSFLWPEKHKEFVLDVKEISSDDSTDTISHRDTPTSTTKSDRSAETIMVENPVASRFSSRKLFE